MLKCKHVTEQASSYLDGEMGFVKRLQFRIHLMMCVHCRRFMHNLKAGIAMVRRLPRNKVNQDRIDAVMRRIRENKQ